MIRWKAVIPTIIALLLLGLAIFFFLDPVVKWAIVKTGQGVFGARVSVESVNLSLRRSSLSLHKMEVADKSEPMKNLFEFADAVFDFKTLPLLEKRVVIDQASLTGLKLGTPRKISGALAFEEKRPGFVGKAADRLWSQVETVSLDKFDGVKKFYDPKTVVNPNELSTYKAAEKAKEQIQKAPSEVQKQIDDLKVQQRTQDLKQRAEALGHGPSDPASIAQKLGEANALQSEIKKVKSDIEGVQKSVSERIQSAQGMVEDVKKAKEEDWKKIKSAVSLPSLDKETIARAIFGPSVAQSIERLLGWVQTSRQYMPAKAKAPPPPPRGKGRTIEFPKEKVWPRFLLQKAEISGELGQDKPFGFLGTLTGVTTNPELYGKPATLVLQGSQGTRSFGAKAIIDHTRERALESFQGNYNGFSLANSNFGQKDSLGLALQQGTGRATAAFTIQEDTIMGNVDVTASDLQVKPLLEAKSDSAIAQRAAKSITGSLSAVKALNVRVGVDGVLSAPHFAVSSNIGDIVAGALKTALGAEVAQQEQALRAELDRQTAAQINQLQGLVDGMRQKYLPQLASNDKVLEDLFDQVKKQATRGVSIPGTADKPLDQLKGLFGR